ERHLESQLLGARREVLELAQRAELWVDRVVAAVRAADRIRAAGVAWLRCERVVAPLAVREADRVDRREVDDVEAHFRDGRKALGGGGEGSGRPRARALVELRALRAGEDLVPGRRQGPFPLHLKWVVG